MSPLGDLVQRLPRTPGTKTGICGVAASAIAASVARGVMLLYGVGPPASVLDLLTVPGVFALGVLTLHVGHCAESFQG